MAEDRAAMERAEEGKKMSFEEVREKADKEKTLEVFRQSLKQ